MIRQWGVSVMGIGESDKTHHSFSFTNADRAMIDTTNRTQDSILNHLSKYMRETPSERSARMVLLEGRQEALPGRQESMQDQELPRSRDT